MQIYTSWNPLQEIQLSTENAYIVHESTQMSNKVSSQTISIVFMCQDKYFGRNLVQIFSIATTPMILQWSTMDYIRILIKNILTSIPIAKCISIYIISSIDVYNQ